MPVTVKVKGLREIEAALADLKKSTGKAALRRALKTAADPLAADMRARAPVAKGVLRSSIGVSTKLSPRQSRIHRRMFRNDKASVEMFVGAGALPHPHLQEFGTVNQPPQPWARPAWDANRVRVLDTIADESWVEVKKSAERARRKTARAAKG